jgi:two-component system nitrogen regulation response regulator GlnG/two-component system response regulator HydG
MSSDDTTVPPVTTSSAVSSEGHIKLPGLSLAWSEAEPWRIGQSAPCLPFETEHLGRAELCIALEEHRPGARWGDRGGKGGLAGRSISRRQVELRLTEVGLKATPMKDASPTFIDDVELTDSVILRKGNAVMLPKGGLFVCVERARTLAVVPDVYKHPLFGDPDAAGIVGESAAIWELRRQLVLAARAGVNVLLLGEKGCGKEHAAKAIHLWSNRAEKPFVPHNAPATTKTLFELDFFGRIKGYPQANDAAIVGLIPRAEGGTLFIDEIANLPKIAQLGLLRPLDPGEYRVMGDPRERIAKLCWVGATNRDPDDPGLLESDFASRWKIRIYIPPVRERQEDIPHLVRHLLLKRMKERPDLGVERFLTAGGPDGRLYPKMSGSFAQYLVRHPLPGNMRDLEAILLASIDASPGDKLVVPAEVVSRSQPVPSSAPVVSLPAVSAPVPSGPAASAPQAKAPTGQKARRDPSDGVTFLADWERVGRNVTQMADLYDVTRMTIYRWMEVYGVARTGGRRG